ncbi:MAG TPA: hypothetical protein VEL31_12990, partial [Ktedonobacteraceae bacterium]|nr:hypothetical protein [Ktedonobacteraceae bacterium]
PYYCNHLPFAHLKIDIFQDVLIAKNLFNLTVRMITSSSTLVLAWKRLPELGAVTGPGIKGSLESIRCSFTYRIAIVGG